MGQRHATAMEPEATRSHLDFVPDAVLCLIMHGLQCEEIARLSQCNQLLSNAANCEFAWSRATFNLKMHVLPPPKTPIAAVRAEAAALAFTIAGSLPKYAHLRLSWRPPMRESISEQQFDAFLTTLDRFGSGRIREFDASHAHRVTTKQFEQILAHPALQRVRCLKLFNRKHNGDYSVEMLRLLTLMPELHTLALWTKLGRPDDYALLGDIPALTSLEICDSGLNAGLSRLLPSVAQCRSLVHLHIFDASLYSSRWAEFCCSPNLASLESLHLQYFWAPSDDTPSHVWRTGFAALKRLIRLHLHLFDGVNRMLLYTVAAPALRTIEVQTVANEQKIEMQMPTPATITSLLEAARAVQLLLRVDRLFMSPLAGEEQAIDALRSSLLAVPGFGSKSNARVQLIVCLDEQ